MQQVTVLHLYTLQVVISFTAICYFSPSSTHPPNPKFPIQHFQLFSFCPEMSLQRNFLSSQNIQKGLSLLFSHVIYIHAYIQHKKIAFKKNLELMNCKWFFVCFCFVFLSASTTTVLNGLHTVDGICLSVEITDKF